MTDTAQQLARVVYRHAWCMHCDDTYTVNPVILDGAGGKRMECPGCRRDIFASYHPAEYFPIIEAAGDGTECGYGDWLAEDAVVQIIYARETRYLYVARSEYAGGFATVEAAHDRDGSRHAAWSPEQYVAWIEIGTLARLVPRDRLYEQLGDAERRELRA